MGSSDVGLSATAERWACAEMICIAIVVIMVLCLGAVPLWLPAAEAQAPPRVWRIGALDAADSRGWAGFREGLRVNSPMRSRVRDVCWVVFEETGHRYSIPWIRENQRGLFMVRNGEYAVVRDGTVDAGALLVLIRDTKFCRSGVAQALAGRSRKRAHRPLSPQAVRRIVRQA